MPQEQTYRQEYGAWWSIRAIFPVASPGVVTGDNAKTIAMKQFEAAAKAEAFNVSPKTVKPILYKVFDTRFVVYEASVVTRSRADVMRHMLAGKNVAIITVRRIPSSARATYFLASRDMVSNGAIRSDNQSIDVIFPLWLYPTEQEAAMGIEREANLAPAFVARVKERIGETPIPEDIFHYAYAVFHAPTYRTRYAAFLKTDFPRLPLPPDAETFQALAALGARLTALHLLEDPALDKHGVGFPVGGSHTVKKMRTAERYVPAPPELGGGGPSAGRVKLNDTEYFENVPPEAWEFRVGGYQPAAKWLEDRAGRTLTADDITHYRRMIAAMRETAALLSEVDAAFLTLLAKNTVPAAEGAGED